MMNTKEIIERLKDVKPYDGGSHIMWTDPYIAEHLLQAHIDPSNDAASRNAVSVKETTDFIYKLIDKKDDSLLDLGCGPGLYTTEFAIKGLKVSGYDFSRNSIDYALEQASNQGLDIHYECKDYLTIEDHESFDIIIMIYCDFGVLSNENRSRLIEKIFKALKPGGMFIFDSLNQRAINKLTFDKSWDISNGGFWQKDPYTSLSERLHFPDIRAILDQHIIIDEKDNYKLYRFWNHYFTTNQVSEMFKKHGFDSVQSYDHIITQDDGVTLYRVQK